MFGPKDRSERHNTPEPKGEPNAEPKKGGFGAFADKYKERWEAEHPRAAKPDKERSATHESEEDDQAPVDTTDRTTKQ